MRTTALAYCLTCCSLMPGSTLPNESWKKILHRLRAMQRIVWKTKAGMKRSGQKLRSAELCRPSIGDLDRAIFSVTGRVMSNVTVQRGISKMYWEKLYKDMHSEHIYQITAGIMKFSMEMHIIQPEERVWSLHLNLLRALKDYGY